MFKQCMMLDAAFYVVVLRPHVDGWQLTGLPSLLPSPIHSLSTLPTLFLALYLQFHINVCPLHVHIFLCSTLTIRTYVPNSAKFVCVLFI